MKKIFHYSKMILIMSIIMVAFTANAQDCSKATALYCDAFNKMTMAVNSCRTIDDFDNVNIDQYLGNMDLSPIETCWYTTISKEDKAKIRASMEKFVDSTENKLYELAGGAFSRNDIKTQMNPMRTTMINLIEESTTYGDLATKMANMQ